MTESNENFAQQFIDESIDILAGQSVPRIRKCLGELSDDEIWRRPNEHLASVGNLILHLCGNVRQWIVSGIGGAADQRQRSKEFGEKGPIPRDELLRQLQSTLDEAAAVLRRVGVNTLTQPRTIQGERTTGVVAIYHVCEHFSYHVGQISLHTKLLKNIDLGYYAGRDLNVTN